LGVAAGGTGVDVGAGSLFVAGGIGVGEGGNGVWVAGIRDGAGDTVGGTAVGAGGAVAVG